MTGNGSVTWPSGKGENNLPVSGAGLFSVTAEDVNDDDDDDVVGVSVADDDDVDELDDLSLLLSIYKWNNIKFNLYPDETIPYPYKPVSFTFNVQNNGVDKPLTC